VAEDRKGRVAPDRRQTRPRIRDFFWVPAIVGLFIVAGVAVVYHFEGSCRILDCIDQVPYSDVPFALFFLAILVEFLEKLWLKRKQRPPATS
jgi:formate hydrogenlyase subunit 3/multisubunit Na+/H+ antiporter MnhD subunit